MTPPMMRAESVQSLGCGTIGGRALATMDHEQATPRVGPVTLFLFLGGWLVLSIVAAASWSAIAWWFKRH